MGWIYLVRTSIEDGQYRLSTKYCFGRIRVGGEFIPTGLQCRWMGTSNYVYQCSASIKGSGCRCLYAISSSIVHITTIHWSGRRIICQLYVPVPLFVLVVHVTQFVIWSWRFFLPSLHFCRWWYMVRKSSTIGSHTIVWRFKYRVVGTGKIHFIAGTIASQVCGFGYHGRHRYLDHVRAEIGV